MAKAHASDGTFQREDLTGRVFGKLTVLFLVSTDPTRWLCRCECGNEKAIQSVCLNKGLTRSCGCLRRQVSANRVRTHDLSKTREYAIWSAMKRRCYNPRCREYPEYGGRGITVCDEWKDDFSSFLVDMGLCPKGMSIERVDNAKGYSKSNCRWATPKEQARNTRRNVYLKAFGREQLQEAWAEEFGVDSSNIVAARRRGVDLENYLVRRGFRG